METIKKICVTIVFVFAFIKIIVSTAKVFANDNITLENRIITTIVSIVVDVEMLFLLGYILSN